MLLSNLLCRAKKVFFPPCHIMLVHCVVLMLTKSLFIVLSCPPLVTHAPPFAPSGVHLDYLSTKLEIFNGVAHPTHFPQIPDFGSSMRWVEQYIHLTPKRILQAKAILCVFASTHAMLTHCPFLPDLTCVLLIFFDEAKTYEYLERMLKRSQQDEYYFTTSGGGFLKWMRTFSILLEQKNNELYTHMQKTLKLDPAKVFQVWLSRFFIQYMPMRTIFRILDAYLFEGNKILFRVSLAVLKMHTKSLLQCKTAHDFLVQLHACMTKQTPGELLEVGFGIYLSRTSHMEKIKTHLHENQSTLLLNPPNSRSNTTHFHLPRFSKEHDHVSEIMGLKELYEVWSWLPPNAAICDPVLLYSSSIHGYSYLTLWKKACERSVGETTGVFLLVHDAQNDQVIGLYLNRPLPNPPEWRTKGAGAMVSLYTGASSSSSATTSPLPLDPQSFLFTLRPQPAVAYRHAAWIERERAQRREEKAKRKQEELANTREYSTSSTTNSNPPQHAQVDQPSHNAVGPSLPGSSDDSRAFKPYGLSRLEAAEATRVSASLAAGTQGAGQKGAGELGHTSLTVGYAGGMGMIGSGGGGVAGDSSLYTNTLNGSHTPNPHSKHHHPHHHHHHHAHTPGVGGHHLALSNDPSQSSHSMMVSPSSGISFAQPLNELFGSLEVTTVAGNSPVQSAISPRGNTLAVGGPMGKQISSSARPSLSSAALASSIPSPTTAAAYSLARSLAHSPLGESKNEKDLPLGVTLAGEGTLELKLPPPLIEEENEETATVRSSNSQGAEETAKSSHDVFVAAESALKVVRQASSFDLGNGGLNVSDGSNGLHQASPDTAAASSSVPTVARTPSISARDRSSTASETRSPEAMLLLTDEGFGIVETNGVVLFLSEDLKSGISGPSTVFASPSFTAGRNKNAKGGPGGAPSGSVLQRGKFTVSTVEVWSFAIPSSEGIAAMNPRLQQRQEEQMMKKNAQ